MFEILKKYVDNGDFLFTLVDDLKTLCNAPTDKSGIYIVFDLKNKNNELIYIGRSGKLQKDGTMFIRKTGLGGIKDRIVNGHQFGKIPRRKSWPQQMKKEKITSLKVHWYVTHDTQFIDCPRILENNLLNQFFEKYKRLPRWNNEL